MHSPACDSWVITFESVHQVMKAEKVLRPAGFDVVLVPTPREISSECGVAVELKDALPDRARRLLRENGLRPLLFCKRKQSR